jgi:hypothetical protein
MKELVAILGNDISVIHSSLNYLTHEQFKNNVNANT